MYKVKEHQPHVSPVIMATNSSSLTVGNKRQQINIKKTLGFETNFYQVHFPKTWIGTEPKQRFEEKKPLFRLDTIIQI